MNTSHKTFMAAGLSAPLSSSALAQSSGVKWQNGNILTAQQMQQLDNAKMNVDSLGKPGFAPKLNAAGKITDPVVGDVSGATANAAGDTVSSISDTAKSAQTTTNGVVQFLVDNLSVDVTDADTPATFSSRIANAVLKLAQISPFNQDWATSTGGYRKYAIVSDPSGTFWVSTADQNTTVPGANGAKWQSLFNGYATEAWANGKFSQLVYGKWALGTTAYQIVGVNWQIADARPAVFYVDANGTQHAGGEIAMYADVTAEQSARETAISNEAVARANADAQLVSGRWALGTTAYQIVGVNWQIADARPAVFYVDANGTQHAGGELMMNSDVTAGTIAASGQHLSGTWTNTRGILRQRFGVLVNAYPMAFNFPIEYGAAPQNVQLTAIPINNESDTLIVNLNGLCTTTGGQFWVVGIHDNQQKSITGNCIVIIDVEAPA